MWRTAKRETIYHLRNTDSGFRFGVSCRGCSVVNCKRFVPKVSVDGRDRSVRDPLRRTYEGKRCFILSESAQQPISRYLIHAVSPASFVIAPIRSQRWRARDSSSAWASRDLEAAIVSYPHADHVGGLVSMLEQVDVGHCVDSGQYCSSSIAQRIRNFIREKRIA